MVLDQDILRWGIAGVALLVMLVSFYRFTRKTDEDVWPTVYVRPTVASRGTVKDLLRSIVVLKKVEFYAAMGVAMTIVILHALATAIGTPEPEYFLQAVILLLTVYLIVIVLSLVFRISLKFAARRYLALSGIERDEAEHFIEAMRLSPFWRVQLYKFIERSAVV